MSALPGGAVLFSIYVFALILGAVLLGASILMGDSDGADADVDAEFDGDIEAHHGGIDAHAGAAGSLSALAGSWRSLRFWVFFAAFFGATGALLDGLGLVSSPVVTLVIAVVMGVCIGQTAVWIFQVIGREDVGGIASETDYIGKTARVLLAFGSDQQGKIRVQLHGTSVDLLATTSDEQQFAENDNVLIIAMDDTRAVVSRAVISHALAEPTRDSAGA